MKKHELYCFRLSKPIEGSYLLYIADVNVSVVVSKFYAAYPDAELVKMTYEGEIYV